MIDFIFGLVWPPYGFYLKKQKFLAEERAEFAKFYKEQYIPALKKQAERQLEDCKRPLLFKKLSQ